MNGAPTVVAVINSSPDVIDMLRLALEYAGFVVVSALTFDVREGKVNLDEFIAQHQPVVILYDVAPPYEANWRLFEHVAAMPIMRDRQFVLSSTNARHVVALAGQKHVHEVVGKPFDIDAIVRAVTEASRARPTR